MYERISKSKSVNWTDDDSIFIAVQIKDMLEDTQLLDYAASLVDTPVFNEELNEMVK